MSAGGAIVFASGGTVWAKDGFWAPDGAWTTITFLLFLAWTLVTSGLLVARAAPVTAPEGVPAASAH